MNQFPLITLIPFFVFLAWVGLFVYGIVLAARLVSATERIARALEGRVPPASGGSSFSAE